MDDNNSENLGDIITTDKVPTITNGLYEESPQLQSQLSLMVSELDREHHRGTIVIRDLIPAMERYEHEHGLTVLTDEQKTMIRPFCEQNPDLELSAEDLNNLVNVAALATAQGLNRVNSPTTAQQPVQSPVNPSDNDPLYIRYRAPSPSLYSAASPVMTHSTPTPRRSINAGEISPFSSRLRTGPLKRGPLNWKVRSTPTSPRQQSGESSHSEEDYPISPVSPCSGDDISPMISPYGRRQSVPSYGRAYDIDDFEIGGNRSPSAAAHRRQLSRNFLDERESSFEGIAGEENLGLQNVSEDPTATITEFYRKSVDLTKRLKDSERSLTTITRQHEERIESLTDKVEELKKDLATKKRELSEFKNKEKSSLQQINTLEANISQLQRSKTDQKQTYISMKKQYEEKCEEISKLQNQLRFKENDMSQTEALLTNLNNEYQSMMEERDRLDNMRRELESELTAARANHIQLEQQRQENEHLRETIDRLHYDLDELRSGRTTARIPGVLAVPAKSIAVKSLRSELAPHSEEANEAFPEDVDPVAHLHAEVLDVKLQELEAEERVRALEGEKDYYKRQADKAKEDFMKMRQALEQEKRSLESQIAELRTQTAPEREYSDAAIQVSTQLFEIGVQCGDGDITMFEELPLDSFSPLSANIKDAFEAINQNSLETGISLPNGRMTVEAGVQCQIDQGVNKELEAQYKVLNNELATQCAIIEGLLKNHEIVSERRASGSGKTVVVDMPLMNDDKGIRQRKPRNAKRSRISFQDMNDLIDATGNNSLVKRRPVSIPGMPPITILVRSNDKIVTNTITFALYTLVVYLFGIVTSTFLIETGQTTIQYGAWEATGGIGGPAKSKVIEVLLYWIEKLLSDGDLMAPT